MKLQHKGNDKTVEVGPRDIFHMAAGPDAGVDALFDDFQIMVDSLPAGHTQFIKNMIIRAADQDSGFFQAHAFNKVKIVLSRPDPGSYLGKLISFFQTLLDSVPVFFTVQKELRLTDDPFRAAQPMHHVIQIHDLFGRIWFPRLLAVPEGRIGDPDMIRHFHGHQSLVEHDLRHFFIVEQSTVKIGLIHVLQTIFEIRHFQEIGRRIHLQLSM